MKSASSATSSWRACRRGSPIRESSRPLTTGRQRTHDPQTCFEQRLLRQDGTGFLRAQERHAHPGRKRRSRRGGDDQGRDRDQGLRDDREPRRGARRGDLLPAPRDDHPLGDHRKPRQRRRRRRLRAPRRESRSTTRSSATTSSTARAARSAPTGDILVVRSHIDGNTTDGDGGAIYTDEDGDVTVIDSTVDGNTADGPGGAIFTLEGDVTIVNSTVNGNRADDRGGAISGEADVTVIGSTIARNAAFAHVGGGVWARSDLFVTNSTISHNYAEGQGGGVLAAGSRGPRQLDRGRQRRPGRRRRGCRIPSQGLRLGHRPTRPGARRRPDPADRAQLPSLAPGVVRLQLRQRRLLRPQRPGRRDRQRIRCSPRTWPTTAAPGRPAYHSRAVPSWTGSPRARAVSSRLATRSRASSISGSSESIRSRRSPPTSGASADRRARGATSARFEVGTP